ncbi:MAG TPA: ATP-binding protein [Rhodothermales bacterium]|nr:ATP-binding protein [Rhodothermales bacterium]
MSEESIGSLERLTGIADVHRDNYRIFCVLAGVLNPAFGIVYQLTDPNIVDPLWARFALGVFSLLLLSLSYMSEWVKEHFVELVHLYFYGLIAFYVGLTAFNGFAADYAMGMMFVVTAVGIIFGLGLKHTGPLVRYLGYCVLLVTPTIYLAPSPQINPAIVSICVISISTVIYVAARAKIRAEEAVHASELRYRKLMNGANDSIFIIDPEADTIVDANYKAQQFIGRSIAELRRMHPGDLYPPEKRDQYLALLYKHAFEGAAYAADVHVITANGLRTPVDVSASLIDVGGRRLVQGIFRDATDRYQYEKELIEARDRAEEMLRLKTSFLNNMTHEIRTPLTSILGFTEVLSSEVPDAQQEFVRTIRDSAKRLHQTLNSVLDLAQLESGKSNLATRTVDVGREIEDIVSVLHPLADQKQLALKVQRKAPHIYADLDLGCLSRILTNLVGNAIKFTDEGYVAVEVDGDIESVYVRVRDTGIGISEEFQQHLFVEFSQESTGISRSYEGNGLGLAITKRLVQLMRGTIAVESIKGLGSTFTITFSRAYPGAMAEITSENPAAGSRPALRRNVLVVEDNQATRYLISQGLGKLYQLELASTPDEALKLAERLCFDVLLLDINLTSSRDGIDVLRSLKSLPGYEFVPAIALTAYSLPGDRESFLKAGFNEYVSKPFALQELIEAIEQVVHATPALPHSVYEPTPDSQTSISAHLLESN